MLSAGYGRIFQVCRCWRENERGESHLPEFTLLEWYREASDYMDLMDECEEMFLFLTSSLGAEGCIRYQGREIELTRPWERIRLGEAFGRWASISMDEAIKTDRFEEVMVHEIEAKLDPRRPTYLYDYPASMAALSRLKESDPGFAERFELYIGGLEIANAFSELTDAEEQAKRFQQERKRRKMLGRPIYPMPDRFLATLTRMPASAGIALGLDRLVMLLTDKHKIDDVVSFSPEEL
jgi:lysyl-tRNA synthetase class 2